MFPSLRTRFGIPPFPVRHAIFALIRRAAAALPVIVLLSLPAWPARGADPSGVAQPTPDIRVGLSGAFKVGRWTPLEVISQSPPTAGYRLEVDAPDPDGSAVTYRSEALTPSTVSGAASTPRL